MKVQGQQDFWAGAMFIGFGLLAIFIAWDFPYGSASRMGPGYFPTWIGGALVVLGSMLVLSGLRNPGEALGQWAFKAMILLGLGFVIFGWAIDHIGFVLATAALVILGAAAGREFRWVEVIIMTIVLIVGSWALFIYGLELPYPLFWWR